MSGSSGPSAFRMGTKSAVAKLYLVSDTTSKPNLEAFARAPAIGFFVKSASAARIATVCGFGSCREAAAKNPSVKAALGSEPVGIIAKNRL